MNHAHARAEPPVSSGSTILKKNAFLVCARRMQNVRVVSGGLPLGRLAQIAAIEKIRQTPPMKVKTVSDALVAGMIGSRSSASIGTSRASAKYGTRTSQLTSRLRT